jgi:hypothetical protein
VKPGKKKQEEEEEEEEELLPFTRFCGCQHRERKKERKKDLDLLLLCFFLGFGFAGGGVAGGGGGGGIAPLSCSQKPGHGLPQRYLARRQQAPRNPPNCPRKSFTRYFSSLICPQIFAHLVIPILSVFAA